MGYRISLREWKRSLLGEDIFRHPTNPSWRGRPYSQEFKNKTTARLLGMELTVAEASEQFKIAQST